jgi:hypothetical protein
LLKEASSCTVGFLPVPEGGKLEVVDGVPETVTEVES